MRPDNAQLERLKLLAEQRRRTECDIVEAIDAALRSRIVRWEDVGRALGVSGQAAHKRYAKSVRDLRINKR